MGNKLFQAIIITLLLTILSGVNVLQPSVSVLAEKPSFKQKLSFQLMRPTPSDSDTVR